MPSPVYCFLVNVFSSHTGLSPGQVNLKHKSRIISSFQSVRMTLWALPILPQLLFLALSPSQKKPSAIGSNLTCSNDSLVTDTERKT